MIKISIIIVNYYVKKELLACIGSIYASRPKNSFEIIVIDNDEKKNSKGEINKKFTKVVYIPNKNNGFGEACNVGATQAKGEYLFFLNPDTEVFPECIDNLMHFLQKKKDAGIVAPLLLGTNGKAYQQGTLTLNPLRAIFSLSIVHKLFPNNSIARRYFLADWDRKSTKEVDVAPGTSFLIRKDLFKKFNGFDENFFLFFEEFDLCKRIREAGYKIFIFPKARVMHAWGVSTKQRFDIQAIFEKSRFYYFKKNFGLLSAVLTESILRFSKYTVLLLLILSVALFLRLYYLHEGMTFMGDQGWYYLSARDMVHTGNIPLVGIASSHPWLHQGAIWTYLLAGGFWFFGFSPFVGGYMTIFIGLLGVLGVYLLGSTMFSRIVGIISAALFATSSLVIALDRMPYHTSPMPVVTIAFIYFLYKWMSGNVRFFPFVIAALGILYNLELATALLGIGTMVVLVYGNLHKKEWARKVSTGKYLLISIVAFVISMLPMLIYDIGHGFPQTLGFAAWIGYKVFLLFGFPPLSHTVHTPFSDVGLFFMDQMRLLLFPYDKWVAIGLFVASIVIIRHQAFKLLQIQILISLNCLLIVGFFVARTPSSAYLPMMFPSLILLVALGMDMVIKKMKVVGIAAVLLLLCLNSFYVLEKNKMEQHFKQRLEVAKYIVNEAEGKEYNLKGEGAASEFESFTMNYEYLSWWMGNGPSEDPQKMKFFISEEKGIEVRRGK